MGIFTKIKNIIIKPKQPSNPTPVSTPNQYSAPIGPTRPSTPSAPSSSGGSTSYTTPSGTKVTSTPIAAPVSSIKSIDYSNKSGKRVGSVTVSGPSAWEGGAGSINGEVISSSGRNNLSSINNQGNTLSSTKLGTSYSGLADKSSKNTISAYKPFTSEEKQKMSKSSYGKEYFRPATYEEKRKAGIVSGFDVGGFIAPFRSGAGTIMGKTSDSPYMAIGDVYGFQLAQKEMSINLIQKKTISQTEEEVLPKYKSRVSEDTTDIELANINQDYKNEVLSITKSKLSSDPDYNKAISGYETTAKELNLPKLEKYNYEKGFKFSSDKLIETAITFSPATAIIPFSKALKETQEMPNYYEGLPGTTTTYFGSAATNKPEFGLSTQGQINVALGSGLALGGAAIGLSNIGKDINAMWLEKGLKSKSMTYGKEIYQKGDETFIKSLSIRKTPEFRQVTRIDTPIFSKGEDKFIVGASKGKTKIEVLDFWKNLRQESNPYRTINKEFVAGAKGQTTEDVFVNSLKIQGNKGFIGTGYSVVDDKVYSFPFQGVTRQKGDIAYGFGGKIDKVKVYPGVKIRSGSPVRDFFKIKKLPAGSSGIELEESKGFISFQGGGAKSSQAYLQSLYSDKGVSGGFVNELSKVVGTTVTKPTSQSSSFFQVVTRPFAATQKTKSTKMQTETIFKNELKVSPIIKSISSQSIMEGTKSKQKSAFFFSKGSPSATKEIERSISIPAFNQIYLQKPATKQIPTLKGIGLGGIAPYSPTFPIGGDYGFKPIGFPLPRLSMFDYEWKGRGRGKQFRGRYAPTVSAIGLNIKAPKISAAYNKGLGALIQRGVISPFTRKSKSKRRKK